MLPKIILYCLLLFFSYGLNAQPLQPGAQCPDVELKNVLNHTASSFKLSSIRKKLIILDFWNTGCLSCIQAFPKMDSLQRAFGNDIQIILVNKQSADSIMRFFKKRKNLKLPGLPAVTGDRKLSALFPHSGFPYHVWLDSSRKVLYFTEGYNATAEHIAGFLKGEDLHLSRKEKRGNGDSTSGPLLDALAGKKVFYSSVTPCVPSRTWHQYSGLPLGKNSFRYSASCQSIADLYIKAYSEDGKYNFRLSNTVNLEVKDSFQYIFPADVNLRDEWRAKHRYSYDLIVSADAKEDAFKIMQQDLYRYFKLDAVVEKKKIPAIVLISTGDKEKLFARDGKGFENFRPSTFANPVSDSIREIRNKPFSILSKRLRALVQSRLQLPFIDETGYDFNIDFVMQGKVLDEFDFEAMKKTLNRYGLDLVKKEVLQPVLVIREN